MPKDPSSESVVFLGEVPKYRKSGKRKRWKVIWRWCGASTDHMNEFQRKMTVMDWVQRYDTEKAANQAVDDWRRGRGIWGNLRRPPQWMTIVSKD